MSAMLITREAFRTLADVALAASPGDHTFVALSDRQGGTARFANNQVVQHVNTRRQELMVSVAIGAKEGTSTTTRLSAEAVRKAVHRAASLAKFAPEDPEYLPPLPPQTYHHFDTYLTGDRRRRAPGGCCPRRPGTRHTLLDHDSWPPGIATAYASARGSRRTRGCARSERAARTRSSA